MEELLRKKLLETVALSIKFCRLLEECRNIEKEEFVILMLNLLPRIYLGFSDVETEETTEFEGNEFFGSYVDEDYYESIRRNIETLLGPSDTFLETFEEDMKYSETPIASSISECLADIFQPLYNFISIVKDSEGQSLSTAYIECKENFIAYWSQTLCNVMRALNHLRYS